LALSTKKKNINTDKVFFASLELDFFRVQPKFAFRIRPEIFHVGDLKLRDLAQL